MLLLLLVLLEVMLQLRLVELGAEGGGEVVLVVAAAVDCSLQRAVAVQLVCRGYEVVVSDRCHYKLQIKCSNVCKIVSNV